SDLTMYNFFKMYEVKVQTSYKTLFEKSLEIVQVYKYLYKKTLLNQFHNSLL
ncbi:MAG: type II-A CRISPR-associated protein Csn2, partial [Enterococcus sp.]|nr:type II-A CRISPR-associated protein Csn2 [Enterococcus sp.]